MDLNSFLGRLEGVKGSGAQYSARCPAHADQRASLSVGAGADGRILCTCHAGCAHSAILGAMGLNGTDLFPASLGSGPKVTTTGAIAVYPYADITGKARLKKRRYPGKKFVWYYMDPCGQWRKGNGGNQAALFHVDKASQSEEIYWVEGEKDAIALMSHGLTAVCLHSGAAGRPTPEQLEPLRGKSVIILPDNDGPGKEHARVVAELLKGIAGARVLDLRALDPELPEKGDISDVYEKWGNVTGRLKDLAHAAPDWDPAQPETDELVFFDAVPYEEPKFLAKPYIPLGKLTIIQADSGVGKTALACKIAACVSRGQPLQEAPCEQGNVLMLSVEDDPSTLRGRIEASGGDVTKCAFLENAHDLHFTSETIEQTVRKHGVKLVIFDPLQAFLGAGMDMHRANETRPVMARLAAMAKRAGCAVMIVSHMSKGTAGGKAIYRALGSVDIPAASRSILYVERNPDDEDQCVMVHTKSSNAEAGKTVLYWIGHRGGVAWEGYSSLTYKDLQARAEYGEKGVSYEKDPVVQVISMLHEDNPKGVFISWEQLDHCANKVLGYFPCRSGKEWNAKLKAMQREFSIKSRIQFEFKSAYTEEHIELGQRIGLEERKKTRGVKIMPFKPQTEFQIRWNE